MQITIQHDNTSKDRARRHHRDALLLNLSGGDEMEVAQAVVLSAVDGGGVVFLIGK